MDPCASFRDRWLEGAASGAEPEDAHQERCAACAEWARRAGAVARAARALPRREAPEALAARVAEDLATLPVAPAAELPVAAAEEAPSPEERRLAGLLATLPRATAPAVLERLVAEELAAPAAARARRFAGGLERGSAPAELEARVLRLLRRGVRRPRLALPLAAAAAALVLAAVALLQGRSAELSDRPRSGRPFEVRYARGPEELSPLARTLAFALRGGEAPRPAPPPESAAGGEEG